MISFFRWADKGRGCRPSSTRLQNNAAVLGLNAWEQLGRSRDLLHRPFGVLRSKANSEDGETLTQADCLWR